MSLDTDTATPDLVDRWPYDFRYIEREEPLFNYLDAYANELRRIDAFLDDLYECRFVESAQGPELAKLAAEVGVTREQGENDESLRFRTQLAKAVASSNGTAEDVRAILALAFGEDALTSITVEHATGAPVVRFVIPQAEIDTIPLTLATFEATLERAFPCGTGVEIVTEDTFAFAEADGTAPAGGAGFGEGEWA